MSGKAIVLIILGCICIGLWIWWYIDSEKQYNQRRTQLEQFKQQLKPGVVIVNTFEHENPFIPTTYDRFKILDIKKDGVHIPVQIVLQNLILNMTPLKIYLQ